MSNRSADELLALWASRRLSLFFIFEVPGKSGGSTVCVIEEFSNDRLRLSWPGETDLGRPGEFIISLKEASRTISDIDVSDLISGSDFIDRKEPFVRITFPSGETHWLVMMLGSGFDDFHISEAVRRHEELASGRIFGLTHEEVMQAAREALQHSAA